MPQQKAKPTVKTEARKRIDTPGANVRLVRIFRNGQAVKVMEIPVEPDPRIRWCNAFNEEYAGTGLTAEPVPA